MGEATIYHPGQSVVIHSVLYFYGDAANDELARQIAADINQHWNAAKGKVTLRSKVYTVVFDVQGYHHKMLTPGIVMENTNPRYNFFRIEAYASTDVSFVDGVGSNTGYFKLHNLLNTSTTAAHEYGHTLGLHHPKILDIRGKGQPGIMYPRGTIVDAAYQYSPTAAPLAPGGTINPFLRKVLQQDIDDLKLSKLAYDYRGTAVMGNFTSLWHERHLPPLTT